MFAKDARIFSRTETAGTCVNSRVLRQWHTLDSLFGEGTAGEDRKGQKDMGEHDEERLERICGAAPGRKKMMWFDRR